MNKVINITSFVFTLCVVLLTVVSVASIWGLLVEDVIEKSLWTIGLLAVVAVVIFAATYALDMKRDGQMDQISEAWRGTFAGIRKTTVYILIAAAVLLALIGILSIWEVLAGDAVWKSLSSLGIIAFSSLVVIVVALERERSELTKKLLYGDAGTLSIGRIIVLAILALVILALIS